MSAVLVDRIYTFAIPYMQLLIVNVQTVVFFFLLLLCESVDL